MTRKLSLVLGAKFMTDRPMVTRLLQHGCWTSAVRAAAPALAGMTFCSWALAAGPEITLGHIREIYARRAARVRSIHISWEGTTTLMHAPSVGKLSEPADLEESGETIVQGDSVSHRSEADSWSLSMGKVRKGGGGVLLQVATASGGYRSYRASNRSGSIASNASRPIMSSPELRYVLPSFVAAAASLILDVPNIAILRREEREEGNVVVIGNTDYNDPRFIGATRTERVLSPARDYQMIESVHMLPDGRPVSRCRISYVEDPEFGHVPRSIRIISSLLSAPEAISHVTELRFRMRFNEAVDPAVFDLTFPPGTTVRDARP